MRQVRLFTNDENPFTHGEIRRRSLSWHERLALKWLYPPCPSTSFASATLAMSRRQHLLVSGCFLFLCLIVIDFLRKGYLFLSTKQLDSGSPRRNKWLDGPWGFRTGDHYFSQFLTCSRELCFTWERVLDTGQCHEVTLHGFCYYRGRAVSGKLGEHGREPGYERTGSCR